MRRTISFDNLKNNIRSFDLIVCTTSSLFSSVINISQYINGSAGRYAHVSFCIKGDVFPQNTTFTNNKTKKTHTINENELYLFESVMNTELEGQNIFDEYHNGVQIRKFEDVFENYFKLKKQNVFTEIAWIPMTSNYRYKLQQINKTEISNAVNKYINVNYNYSVIDKLHVPFHNYFIIKQLKWLKDYVYGEHYENKGLLCTELVAHILNDFDFINIHPGTLITEDFFYETPLSKQKKYPLIYLEPLDIHQSK